MGQEVLITKQMIYMQYRLFKNLSELLMCVYVPINWINNINKVVKLSKYLFQNILEHIFKHNWTRFISQYIKVKAMVGMIIILELGDWLYWLLTRMNTTDGKYNTQWNSEFNKPFWTQLRMHYKNWKRKKRCYCTKYTVYTTCNAGELI